VVTLRVMRGFVVLLGLIVAGCAAAPPVPSLSAPSTALVVGPATAVPSPTAAATAAPPSPSATPMATSTTVPSLSPSVSAFAIVNTLPLPSCTYDLDVPTPLVSQEAWSLTLVDSTFAVPADYVPADLVSANPAGFGGFRVRAVALPDLRALAAVARGAGIPIGVASTYRSYSEQQATFRGWQAALGQEANIGSARPGHSEHQLGLAIDFTVPGHMPWEYYNFERDTVTGKWLAANAWRYGFVLSYPWRGRVTLTCYGYEPWHFRYVGRAEAAAVRSSGLTLRQWLWLRQPLGRTSEAQRDG
jgi:LAS superfamily LD-carboxypeptidase LdcB